MKSRNQCILYILLGQTVIYRHLFSHIFSFVFLFPFASRTSSPSTDFLEQSICACDKFLVLDVRK